MLRYLVAYASTLAAFLVIDAAWLGVVARRFYLDRIGHLMAAQPNWLAAGLFYAVYAAGIVFFVTAPALRADSLPTALLYGAILGVIAYGTYDMTNYATLKDWPLSLVAVDIAWGAVLTAVSAGVGVMVTRALVPA